MGRTINYHGGQKIYDTEQIDSFLNDKQDKLTIDTALSDTSSNPVENKAIKSGITSAVADEASDRDAADTILQKAIDAEKSMRESKDALLQEAINTEIDDRVAAVKNEAALRETADNTLDTKITAESDAREAEDAALQEQIDNINDLIDPADAKPIKDSKKFVTSGGIYDAIMFASVKVGETMFWPAYETIEREMMSDEVLKFTGADGKAYSYTIPEDKRKVKVSLCVATSVPDGWHALDGKTELSAEDYPELAAFFRGDNTTTDKKIWLPYVQQKIIKIAY